MLEVHVFNRHGSLLRAYALGDRPEVIVGRDESCDIRIKAASVSREHCSIEERNGAVTLRDLESSSGTFVNGHPIDAVRVHNGLEVCVGPAVLKFFSGGI